jgi:hypothetical protein
MTDKRGAAALMLVLVLTAFVLILVSSLMLRGVDELENGFSKQLSSDLMGSAESCVEEALLRLTRDNSYAGGTLEVGQASCAIVVSGGPCGSCTIQVDAEGLDHTRSLQVGVTVSGSMIDLTSWEEI